MLKLISSFLGPFRSPHYGSADVADFLVVTVLSNALLILGTICAIFQFVWRPIDCFVPAAFSEEHASYAKSYCQTPLAKWHLFSYADRDGHQPYPQFRHDVWFPILLLWHAAFLRLPRLVRMIMSNRSDVHLINLIKSTACYRGLEDGGKRRMAKTIASVLRSNYSAKAAGSADGSSIARVKIALRRSIPFGIHGAAAIVGSILLATCSTVAYRQLGGFLTVNDKNNNNDTSYDWSEEFQKMIQGQQGSSVFPSVILCQMEIYSGGMIHKYSLQCHLPLNTPYQLLSMLLWFVYVLAGVVAWIASVHQLVIILLPWPRKWFVRKCLRSSSSGGGFVVNEFLRNNLLTDAYFVLKSLSESADDLVVYDVVEQLWRDVNDPANQMDTLPVEPTNDTASLYPKSGMMTQPLLSRKQEKE